MRQPLQRTGTWLMVLLLLLPAATLAARERTGSICGIVVDKLGNGLIRANVFLMDESGTTLLDSTLTDIEGRFLFPGLFPETYQLRAERTGFQPAALGPVAAESGRMATAPFVLRHSPEPPPSDAAGVAPVMNDSVHQASIQPARQSGLEDTPEPEGTLAETLAGVNRDALKALDRPGALIPDPGDQPSRPPGMAGQTGINGDLMIAGIGSGAAGDQSILMASLAGRTLGPTRWTVELTRENNPSLFSSGLGGPLLWRVVRTESAAFELSSMPLSDIGTRLPEQTFRLELAERFTSEDPRNGPGFRSVGAEWDRTMGGGRNELGLDLFYARGSGADGSAIAERSGPAHGSRDQATLLLLGGRIRSQWAATHELLLHWRHGSLSGNPAYLPFSTTDGMPGAPGGFITPLAEGWETVINGSDRWEAFDPLHLLCNMEYRIAGGESSTRLVRPSMGLVYAPFDRMSVTSSVGLALRSSNHNDPTEDGDASFKAVNDNPSRQRHNGLEYGVSLEQGFGLGYNLELDLSVEDVQPPSITGFDPSAAFGPAAGGMILLADGGTARKREMRLSLSKQFGTLLASSLGTSFLDGSGDILALAAVPSDDNRWADTLGGTNRVRGVSGHFDTFLPTMGTGILVTFHHLSNTEAGLQERNHSAAGDITGLDVGLRQRILSTAGLDLQLLMAISGLAFNEHSFHGVVDSLIGEESPYRRIVGGLRVHF